MIGLKEKLESLKLAHEMSNDNHGEFNQGYFTAIDDLLNLISKKTRIEDLSIGQKAIITKHTQVIVNGFCENGNVEVIESYSWYQVAPEELTPLPKQ